MEGFELVDKAMNVGYRMIIGDEIAFEPSDSNEVEDMIFIPDPEQDKNELAQDLIEYFIETEEYEKCANIRDAMRIEKVINKLIND